jgi:chemotaxis protein methyltransferase CheR
MIAGVQAGDIERFRAAIVGRLGLYFDEGKSSFLAEVLRRRCDATGHDSDTYLSRLEMQDGREEVAALARELTVPETYFFRNADQLRAFVEIVLPQRVAAQAGERRVRMLSLGCASGEEAYSLAMLAHDTLSDPTFEVSILGVDVNPTIIEKARLGRFSAWALRETPEADRQRWFRRHGTDFVLDESLRASVRFEERNLTDEDPQFWRPETYEVVFCRNVVMYFAPEQAQALIDRIARVLRPGGYLFLGHAETLRGLSSDFHLRHTHGTFYYQRKEQRVSGSPGPQTSAWRSPPNVSLAAAAADADTWVDAIRRASERVASLTDIRCKKQAGSSANPGRATAAWDLGVVIDLLRKERFAEALALVDALPPDSSSDPDVLLLRAVLLVHGGQLAKAEDACSRLLDEDEMSAGAHYLLALCREGAGERAAAAYHDQVAAYLDPGFAMARLHLGLLARRAGERDVARRELGHALTLLQREDASRILLFGGGFGREALVALCRTELLRCGGKP